MHEVTRRFGGKAASGPCRILGEDIGISVSGFILLLNPEILTDANT